MVSIFNEVTRQKDKYNCVVYYFFVPKYKQSKLKKYFQKADLLKFLCRGWRKRKVIRAFLLQYYWCLIDLTS